MHPPDTRKRRRTTEQDYSYCDEFDESVFWDQMQQDQQGDYNQYYTDYSTHTWEHQGDWTYYDQQETEYEYYGETNTNSVWEALGLPPQVQALYKEKGIEKLYGWQEECLLESGLKSVVKSQLSGC